jgi:hypothetical protein
MMPGGGLNPTASTFKTKTKATHTKQPTGNHHHMPALTSA